MLMGCWLYTAVREPEVGLPVAPRMAGPTRGAGKRSGWAFMASVHLAPV